MNISRENRCNKLRTGWKERIFARENSYYGSLEYNMDGNNNNWDSNLTEEIAMPLISKKVDVPSISSSSETSIYRIDNELASMPNSIDFKRAI